MGIWGLEKAVHCVFEAGSWCVGKHREIIALCATITMASFSGNTMRSAPAMCRRWLHLEIPWLQLVDVVL